MDSRTLDRVTAFTDAAVAIALTLLVLPLVDVAHASAAASVPALLGAHLTDFLAFVLSFFVVATFWRAHRRLFDQLAAVDEGLLTLNMLWLLGVVFLPVPTAVLTFEGDAHGATLLYLGNLFAVTLCGLALGGWVHRRPGLQRTDVATAVPAHVRRGLVVSVTLAVVGALALLLGPYALWGLLALPVLQAVAARWRPARQ